MVCLKSQFLSWTPGSKLTNPKIAFFISPSLAPFLNLGFPIMSKLKCFSWHFFFFTFYPSLLAMSQVLPSLPTNHILNLPFYLPNCYWYSCSIKSILHTAAIYLFIFLIYRSNHIELLLKVHQWLPTRFKILTPYHGINSLHYLVCAYVTDLRSTNTLPITLKVLA